MEEFNEENKWDKAKYAEYVQGDHWKTLSARIKAKRKRCERCLSTDRLEVLK